MLPLFVCVWAVDGGLQCSHLATRLTHSSHREHTHALALYHALLGQGEEAGEIVLRTWGNSFPLGK